METNISNRPPSVWYIDNCLPQKHQMFDNAPVRYEPKSQQYAAHDQLSARSGYLPVTPPPPRPEYTDLQAMRVWNSMYLAAIDGFRSTNRVHKGRADQYNIHNASSWDDVYLILEKARDKYKDEGGAVGWIRKVRRKAANNVAPVQIASSIASKMVPDNPFSTPVLGAVGMLLDAVKQSAAIRKQVADTFDGDGFENLVAIFSDVELFLGDMFERDRNIHKASLELSIAALKAIDLAIGFFTNGAIRQSSKALFLGDEYEQPLVDSLKDLNAKSKRLVEEAYKSHMHLAHLYSEHGRRMMGILQDTVVDGFNFMNRLLGEHTTSLDAHLQRIDEQLAQQNRNMLYLMVENERLRSVSPAPSPWLPPALPAAPSTPIPYAVSYPMPGPVSQPYISQEQLGTALGMAETDWDDMNFILSIESRFPTRERARVEQITQQQQFVNWVVSAESSKLLVQWQTPLPHTYADLTPLSLFCTKIVQLLESKNRFVSIQWFYGRHLRDNSQEGSGHVMLKGLVAQLLRAYPNEFNMQALSQSIDLLSLLHSPDIGVLCRLLKWLVHSLPRTTTLFCFVDGVLSCERAEHWDTASFALSCLLQLVRDEAVQASFKLMFTSAPGPRLLRAGFEDEGAILNVGNVPRLALAPSDERMARELSGIGSLEEEPRH